MERIQMKILYNEGENFREGMADIRTEGLKENFGFELQLVLHVHPEVAAKIFTDFITRTIISYQEQDLSIMQESSYKVKEIGPELIRLVVEDPNGNYPGDDECIFPFNQQEKHPKRLN